LSAAITRTGSADEVVGEKIARSHVLTRGSIFRASSSLMLSSGTSFARPRRSSSSSCGKSSGPCATTSFPHRLSGMVRDSQ